MFNLVWTYLLFLTNQSFTEFELFFSYKNFSRYYSCMYIKLRLFHQKPISSHSVPRRDLWWMKVEFTAWLNKHHTSLLSRPGGRYGDSGDLSPVTLGRYIRPVLLVRHKISGNFLSLDCQLFVVLILYKQTQYYEQSFTGKITIFRNF